MMGDKILYQLPRGERRDQCLSRSDYLKTLKAARDAHADGCEIVACWFESIGDPEKQT